MPEKKPVIIIGGGLAGCEAAWQLLRRGHSVRLHEMKPQNYSPAHKMESLAELVCSNSLKSNNPESAPGLLKDEMRRLNSIILSAADANCVAAGSALAVDRINFSKYIEEKLQADDNFTLVRSESTEIHEEYQTIIATGPLTSDALAARISEMLGSDYLYFYDAIAPIIDADSINMEKAYWASRYDKGTPDYLNCPLTRDEYDIFRRELLNGEIMAPRPFEEIRHFEGCLPIEILAARGENTMAFGPMKPVGLVNPKTGKIPYACVQLRRENLAGTLFNMVGFQTKLTWPEQKRIFRIIPALEHAEFARYGSIHRNTYIDSPTHLNKSLQLKTIPNIFFAGQITGVEGYIESSAMGLLAGLSAAFIRDGKQLPAPPEETAIGALINYITAKPSTFFQPMNINFGLLKILGEERVKKDKKKHLYVSRAKQALDKWIESEMIL